MSCALPGCDVEMCRATTVLEHEALMFFIGRRKWMLERQECSVSSSEWGRPDFDLIWEQLLRGEDPPSSMAKIVIMLAVSSPTAFPEGWTPRRAAALETIRLVRDTVSLGKLCLGYGYTVRELEA